MTITGDIGAARDTARRSAEGWLSSQNEAFKAAVDGAHLEQTLGILTKAAVKRVPGATNCAFYIANDDRTALSHVVGMPDSYAKQIEGFPIGKDSLACGLAVGIAEPIITPDVREDPRWKSWLWLAEEYGYRGCWSFPVEIEGGSPAGTFALYFAEPRAPTAFDLDIAETMCRSASLLISQQRIVAKMRASEERFRSLFESMAEGFYLVELVRDDSGLPVDVTYLEENAIARAAVGMDARGRRLSELNPLELEEWLDILDEVQRTGEPVHLERHSGLTDRWLRHHIFRPAGEADRVGIIFEDITAQKWADQLVRENEKRLKGLLAELQYRVRNTLAVVKSITQRTAESSQSVDEMAAHLSGRLEAFARVQSAVTRNPEAGVDLRSLIEDELLAHAAREGNGVAIRGPEIALKPKAAESMSLALHELTTNAVKHGALANNNGGKIAIKWKVEGKARDKLAFEWLEKSGDGPIPEPTRQGFGMELLTRLLPYDLGAKTSVDFNTGGITFEMQLPLTHLIERAQPKS